MSLPRRPSRSFEAPDREVRQAARRADQGPPSPPLTRPPRLLLHKSQRSVSVLQTTRRGRKRRRVVARTPHQPPGIRAPSFRPCQPPSQPFPFPPSEVCLTCLDWSPMQAHVVGMAPTHSRGTGTERGTEIDTGIGQIITEDRTKVSPIIIYFYNLFELVLTHEFSVRSSHSSPRETRPSPSPVPILPPPRVAPPPPVPEVPREDLTERLRKEFGLNIDESDGEDGESGGGLEALTARLQSSGPRPEETKKVEEPARHRAGSESWDQKQSSHRGTREEAGKSRERGEEKGRLKVEKTGRASSGLPNQGNRSSRPRTPIGSPTRRASGEASLHGKERPKNYSSKNYFAS